MGSKLYIKWFINVTDSDTENEMIIEGIFKAGDAIMRILTIDPLTAGIYTAFTNDGASGTLELSKNGTAYAAFSSPYTLQVGDTLQVNRTITTGDGYYKLTGTINTKILGCEFGVGELASDEFTIDSSSSGSYTDIHDNGGNGTITISVNGAAGVAFSSPLSLNIGDTIQINRTTGTGTGTIKLYGN